MREKPEKLNKDCHDIRFLLHNRRGQRIHNNNIIAINRKLCYIFRKIMFFVKFILNFVYCVFCLILANEFDSKYG